MGCPMTGPANIASLLVLSTCHLYSEYPVFGQLFSLVKNCFVMYNNFMRIFLTLAIVLLLSGTCCAQDADDVFYTDNHINGKFWKRLDFDEKLFYLYGIVDGITVVADSKPIFDEAHNIRPSVSDMILRSTKVFFVPKGGYKEIVGYIDGFYKKKANLELPVLKAYTRYLAEQKEWSTLEGWGKMLDGLRTGPAE